MSNCPNAHHQLSVLSTQCSAEALPELGWLLRVQSTAAGKNQSEHGARAWGY